MNFDMYRMICRYLGNSFLKSLHLLLEVSDNDLGQLNLYIHYSVEQEFNDSLLVLLEALLNLLDIPVRLVLVHLEVLTLAFLLHLELVELLCQLLLDLGQLLLSLELGILLHL